MSMHDALGLLAELFTWIGLAVGGVFGILWLVALSMRTLWVETDAVVVGEASEARLRWIGEDGALRERALEPWELDELAGDDHCRVLHRGEHARLKGAPHPGRALGVLAIVFLGLGLAAVVLSFVLLATDA